MTDEELIARLRDAAENACDNPGDEVPPRLVFEAAGALERMKRRHNDAWDKLAVLARERDEARAASQWQPISTAPKDGTEVLVYGLSSRAEFNEPGRYVAQWCKAYGLGPDWYMTGTEEPVYVKATKWMPLPQPPKEDGDE